jgi:GR25 family glycosyltransferase involved in LPS biosynthesis
MKYYYINLDDSVDRRIFMENQFLMLNITNYERISGITDKTVDCFVHEDDKKDNKYICDITNKYFKNCKNCKIERAVLQSHLKAIQRGYDNGDEYFVILEDDITIPYNIDFNKLINEFVPNDWEILQLSCSMPATIKTLYEIFEEKKILFIPWQMIIACAGSYICNRKAVKKILDTYKKKGKWRFKDIEYCRLADVMIFQIFKTYSSTFPMYYSNIGMGSLIHPDHLPIHEEGVHLIKKIIKESSKEPLPFLERF